MIQENQKLFNRLNIFTDIAISFFAIVSSYLLIFNVLDFERNYPIGDYLKLMIVFIPVQLLTFGCLGLYDSFRTSRIAKELWRIVQAFLIDGIILIALLYVVKVVNFSRWVLVIFLFLDLLMVAVKRVILRQALKHFRRSGYNKKYVLIIGGGETARHYLETIRRETHMGFECAGYIAHADTLDAKLMGGYDDIFDVLDKRSYNEVVCALDAEEILHIDKAVEACEQTGTKISVIPAIYKYMSATPMIDMVGDIPVMNVRRIPLDNVGNAFMKRAMDIIGALVLLVPSLPVMLVSAIVIKITMGGKVIFKQQRVGLNKKIFTMYKLKSMKDNTASDTAWSTDNDPRKTRFGSFIRKFSIDELPQLFNVLKGDMSLVGPRPEIPFYVNNFKQSIPMYMLKHQVKPGMTGLAQINGFRGDTSIERRIEYDIEYIENWNIFLDISILIKTALMGFMNKEKIKKNKKKFNAEKYLMNKTTEKTDYLALAIFFPAVVALAIIPIIMKITMYVTDSLETYRLFGGEFVEKTGLYYISDVNTMGKASAICIMAVIMLAVALMCCVFMFRHAEKRMLVYTGSSVVFVLLSLMSALGSDFKDIAFNGAHDRNEGFFVIASYFVMFLFTMYAFRKTQNFKYVITALMICTGVNFIIGIFQFTGNNLLTQEWFSNLITDGEYKGMLNVTIDTAAEKGTMYGALYHYNYVGSFAGMIVPLFTVLTAYGKTVWQKILFGFFALISIFMLFASTARSGLVAVAVAAVVGIIVFARVFIRHWKVTVSVVGAALVLVVGANFALDNALFKRIPSLIADVVDFVAPADDAVDLFSTLPVREIVHNDDGSVTFVTQTDELNVAFDAVGKRYSFTDKNGEDIVTIIDDNNCVVFNDEDFPHINLEFASSNGNPEYDDYFLMWFDGGANQYALVFSLFNERQIHMVHPDIGDRITPENAEAIGFEGKELLGSSRGYIWSRTFPLLKDCIFTGYGPDTYAYEFPQNDYLAKYYAYNEGFYITVDKPHNLYIQIWFSNGLVALIAFLVICVFYLVDCFRLYALKKEYRIEQIYGISIMLAVVGYLGAGMFNDSVVSVAPVFWILLGVGAALNTINRRADRCIAVDADGVVVDKRKKVTSKQIKQEHQRDNEAQALAEKLGAQRDAAAAAAKAAADIMSDPEKLAAVKAKMAEVQAVAKNEKNDKTEAAEKPREEEPAEKVTYAEELSRDAEGKKVVTEAQANALYEKVQRLKARKEQETAANNQQGDNK